MGPTCQVHLVQFSLLWRWSRFSKIVAKDFISISTDGWKGNWLIVLIDKVDRYDGIKLIAHWKLLQDRLLVLNRTTGAFKILKDMITSRQWTLLHVCNVILTPGLASSSGLILTQILSIFRAPSPPTSHGYMSGESKMPSTPPLGPIYYYKWFKWSPDRSAHCKHQNVHAFPLRERFIEKKRKKTDKCQFCPYTYLRTVKTDNFPFFPLVKTNIFLFFTSGLHLPT